MNDFEIVPDFEHNSISITCNKFEKYKDCKFLIHDTITNLCCYRTAFAASSMIYYPSLPLNSYNGMKFEFYPDMKMEDHLYEQFEGPLLYKKQEKYEHILNFNNEFKEEYIIPKGFHDDILMYNTFWEIWVKELYQNDFCSIRENDVVVDVGANIGIFSLYAMSKGAKQIFAFEPVSETYKLLKHNCNFYDAILTYELAVSNKFENREFVSRHFSAGSSFYDTNQLNYCWDAQVQKTKVNTIDFNSFFSNTIIDYLKIDCEGGEWDIFENIEIDILSKIRNVCIEIHPIHNYDEYETRIKHKLLEANFELKEVADSDVNLKNGQLVVWGRHD